MESSELEILINRVKNLVADGGLLQAIDALTEDPEYFSLDEQN